MIDELAHVEWHQPLWLWLAFYPWTLWTLQAFLHRSRGQTYADRSLLPWARADALVRIEPRRWWRPAALALAWVFLASAMAGPRIEQRNYSQNAANETQLVVVVDLSRSMSARDVTPTRLERAKLELQDLVARAARLKIGIVVYAAHPHLMTPPTDDKSVLRDDLQALRDDLLPTEGSDLGAAIGFAARQFTSQRAGHALLLVTDGEMALPDASAETGLENEVSRLAQRNIRLYALGVGTIDGAPLFAHDGGWLRYQGRAVVSRLHEHRLKRLAAIGRGVYANVSDTDAEWRTLYDQHIRFLHGSEQRRTSGQLIVWRELYAWPLIAGVLLLLIAYLEPRSFRGGATLPIGFAALLALSGLQPPAASAATHSLVQRAYDAYQKESYAEAQRAYAEVPGYAGRMGEGGSDYRLRKYPKAIQQFTQAILDADTDTQRAQAIFNLANSHYQLQHYAIAANLYREVLRYDAKDKAAQINLGFASAMAKRSLRASAQSGAGGPGNGPRTTSAPEGTDVTHGNLRLDNRDRHASGPVPLGNGNARTQSPLHSRLAIEREREFSDPNWHYAPTPISRIVQDVESLHVDESTLWQRIFATEEGFDAPIDKPQRVPGVQPW